MLAQRPGATSGKILTVSSKHQNGCPHPKAAWSFCHCERERGSMTSAGSAARAAVLTSWKEIARYMGKGVRTVQRWEMDFGLPVRRPQGSNKKAILARPSDLDAWVAMRCTISERAREKAPALYSRASLSAEIATARNLLQNQTALRVELEAAIVAVREQLRTMCEQGSGMQPIRPRGMSMVHPAVETMPVRTADGAARHIPQLVPDGTPPTSASQGPLLETPAAEDPSTLRFPEAMGA